MNISTHTQDSRGIHWMTCADATKRAMSELMVKLRQIYSTESEDMYCLFDLRELPEMSAYRIAQQMRPIIEKHVSASHVALVLNEDALNAPDIALHTVHNRNSVQYFTSVEKAEDWLRLEAKRAAQSNNNERLH
jgi:hypothetical protein